jgi:polyhydroxyalkanoate synthesis regulator phasin
MVLDGLRAYLQLANGLTDITRERARTAAKSLVAQGEASVGAVLPDSLKTQVSSLTDDLVATSKANRALLIGLVRAEVERATSHLGLTMTSELKAMERRSQRLEQKVADLERDLRAAQTAPTQPPATKAVAKKAVAKKAVAKKAVAKKTATTKSATKRSATKKSTT